VSVNNVPDEVKQTTRRLLLEAHPLAEEDPLSWNNIPECVARGMQLLVTHVVKEDECLLEYQVATNNRLYKLQDQANRLRGGAEAMKRLVFETLDHRLAIMERTCTEVVERTDRKLGHLTDYLYKKVDEFDGLKSDFATLEVSHHALEEKCRADKAEFLTRFKHSKVERD
jgi:hypothetical protein